MRTRAATRRPTFDTDSGDEKAADTDSGETDDFPSDDMDFGTQKHPQCGICHKPQRWAHYKRGVLQEGVVCADCLDLWTYDSDADGYVKSEEHEEATEKDAECMHVTQQLRDPEMPLAQL